ncbi:MAG: type II toxin-antitoxin system VapC family toxin [Kiritimatiellae bacterium]|jgi:tRNA(fMet)-specific endonuclease VapC|nr:type II toxin-antitoxin system VapC family toxin [Kiritimatiellia bacterium]
MRYMLDTNICIYIIKQSPPSVYERFQNLRIGDIGVSAITFYELQFGIAKSQRPKQNQLALTEFLAPLEILDLPAEAAPIFGELRAFLQKQGTPIGNYDLLIAAHALHLGATLITNNVNEFERVPSLNIENWV